MSAVRWPSWSRALTVLVVLLATVALGVTSSPRSGAATGPCGTRAGAPSRIAHVVWIVFENKSYSEVIGSRNAPYLNRVADECGIATRFRAEAHPSLPNYLAMTSGSTHGIRDDNPPADHRLHVQSIFGQTRGSWHALEESMPAKCARTNSGLYAVRHNPAAYYTPLASQCATHDVPLINPPNLSAELTFITPNLCDDMHNCPADQTTAAQVAAGDRWLARELPKIFASHAYLSGAMVVFLTWDEDGPGQHVPTVVVSPYTRPRTRDATSYTHYSLLRTTEQLLGIPVHLGAAATATSMERGFHL